MSVSPGLIWSKLFTSGPTLTVAVLPLGPVRVIRRLPLSTASTLALNVTLSATTTAGFVCAFRTGLSLVCASAAGAIASSAARMNIPNESLPLMTASQAPLGATP